MRPGPPGTGFRQHEKADTRCDPPSHSMPNEASTLSQHIAQPDAVIVASRDVQYRARRCLELARSLPLCSVVRTRALQSILVHRECSRAT
jgi:hypothetical protein